MRWRRPVSIDRRLRLRLPLRALPPPTWPPPPRGSLPARRIRTQPRPPPGEDHVNTVEPSFKSGGGTLGAVPADGIRVFRHDGDGTSWTMAHGVPHPGLAGTIAGTYCGYEERSAAPFRRRESATGHVAMIISFGEPIDLVEMSHSTSGGRRLTSFVVGLHEGYAVTQHAGAQHGVQVDLTALGAARLLGGPPTEGANECVALDDLLGGAAGELA